MTKITPCRTGRLFAGAIFTGALLAAAVGFAGIRGLSQVAVELDDIARVRLPSVRALGILRQAQAEVRASNRGMLAGSAAPAHQERMRKSLAAAWVDAERGWGIYAPLPQTAEEKKVWDEFVPVWTAWKDANDRFLRLAEAGLKNREAERRATAFLFEDLAPLYFKTGALLDRLIRINMAEVDSSMIKANRASALARRLIHAFPLAVLSILVALFLASLRLDESRGKVLLLEEARARNEILLREVHHRVKNNLQVVTSILSLAWAGGEKKTQEALTACRTRVEAIAAVHDILHKAERLDRIGAREFIGGLARSCAQIFSAPPPRLEIDDIAIPLDAAVPLGLMINEILSNAYKHGGGAALATSLSLREEGGRIKLVVQDSGPGFSAAPRAGMGTTLINAFQRQLGAALIRVPGPGARYEIEFPLRGEIHGQENA
jgi:two-component sensor histidine kinase